MKTQTLRHLKGLISLVGISTLSFFGFFLNIDKGENKSLQDVDDIKQEVLYEEYQTTSYNADGYEDAPGYSTSLFTSSTKTIHYETENSTSYNGVKLNGIYWTDYHNDVTMSVSIPSQINGKDVVEIASSLDIRVLCGRGHDYGRVWYPVTTLDRVILPSTVRKIHNDAFLDTIYSKKNENTTYDLSACSNLEYVGTNAFCSGISGTIVKIPATLDKLTYVGDNAFKNVLVKTYNQNNQISMPNVKTIGDNAFYGCIGLKKVDFASVESMGASAFQGCTNIENITLPQTLTTLGNYTFKGCTNLATVTSNSPKLSEGEFQNCPQMNLSKLNTTITEVPAYCFDGCSTLKNEEKFANICQP